MTREVAIAGLKAFRKEFSGYEPNEEMFDMAIKALEQEQTFKWCETCKEYDQEKHCCHRWSKVIRDTVEEMKQEQEPFINKPCVSSEVCEHDKNKVLDKIREEIKVMTSNRGFLSCSVGYIHKEIDNVFDKYKAESGET